MAVIDLDKYVNSLVGRAQGAQRFFIKAAGYFQFYDQELTGLQLKNMIGNQLSIQNVGISATSAAADFDVLNLAANVGVVYLSMTSNHVATGPSFYLTSCVQGQDVWIHCIHYSGESGIATLQLSGCSLVYYGVPATSITLYCSAASAGAVHLRCINDDEWTVIGQLSDGGVVAD